MSNISVRHLNAHDLKHTYGHRLRAAGVPLETRRVLLGHKNDAVLGAGIAGVIETAERVCYENFGKTSGVTLLKKKRSTILARVAEREFVGERISVRVGVNTGSVVAGNVGAAARIATRFMETR